MIYCISLEVIPELVGWKFWNEFEEEVWIYILSQHTIDLKILTPLEYITHINDAMRHLEVCQGQTISVRRFMNLLAVE